MRKLFTKRGRLEIVYGILSLCRKPTRKTRILYGCNLSYEQLQRYLEFLVSHELLYSFRSKGRAFYRRTDKGKEFLDGYVHLNCLLEEQENPGYTIGMRKRLYGR